MVMRCIAVLLLALSAQVVALSAAQAKLRVAVAANFYPCASQLAKTFELQFRIPVDLISGASGALATQIALGAPYDVFMSADMQRIAYLQQQGAVIDDSVAVYAQGIAVIWSARHDINRLDLSKVQFVIANPELAPYGKAGMQILERLQNLHPRVQMNNIAQVYQVLTQGHRPVGVIALAQLADKNSPQIKRVPDAWYTPIIQGMAIIQRGDTQLAGAWHNFIMSEQTQKQIIECGFKASNERG